MIEDIRKRVGTEQELLDLFTDWIQQYHCDGGDFSMEAIAAAGDTGRHALRSGLSSSDAFEAARIAYFDALRSHLRPLRSKLAGSS